MANENLKNALEQAGLTVEQFADIIQVDPKSVQRWVTGPTVPYPRHRARIASALDLVEQDLWPGQAPESTAAEHADAAAVGSADDVTGAWGSTDDDGAPDLVAFVTDATGRIDVLDSCCAIEISQQFIEALLEQTAAGRQVRILTDGRSPHWEPLLGHDTIELYLCEIPGEYWLLRTGDRMLLSINLEEQPASSPLPPILELASTADDGIFHRLAARFEQLWEHANDTGAGTGDQDGSSLRLQTNTPAPVPEPGVASDAGDRRWPGQRT